MEVPDELGARIEANTQALKRLQELARGLAVATVCLALVVLLAAGLVFGDLVNYYTGDVMLWGSVLAGVAVLSFGFGWFAGWRFSNR
ncbi:MAG: hypothetical protein ACOY3P_10605 [Planctomycetota bacterium]